MLQDIQDKEGFLSRDSVVAVAEHLKLPSSKVYGVATFYNQFRFHPLGKYHIEVCRGTACHVKGSAEVLEELKRILKIDSGQTTRDGLFSLEVVACVGACGLAPVIAINGEFFARLDAKKTGKVINDLKKKATENE